MVETSQQATPRARATAAGNAPYDKRKLSYSNTFTNPWKSNTLEWTTPVEHMHGNWPGKIPHVHRWAYDYSKPGQEEDFVPQNVPLAEGEEELQH